MTNASKIKRRLLMSSVMAGMIAAPAAYSQDEGGRLDTIVVTAQKREETAQNVPIAISALGSNEIDKYGINDVYDLRGTVPSLEVRRPTAFGNPVFTIRGVGSTNFDTIAGAVVATYFDDIPLVSVGQLNFTTFDLQTIEVLKGPQGTLFGSGTTAGVVHFKSKRPTEEFEGYASIEGGNYGLIAAEGAVSGPLAENLYGRISVRGETFNGYYENLATGQDAGGQDAAQFRGQLLWDDGANSVLIGARYQYSDGSSTLYDTIPLLEDDGTGTGTAQTCSVIQAALDRGRLFQSDVELARTQCVDIFGDSQQPGEGPYADFNLNIYDNDIPIDLTSFGFNVRGDFQIGELTLTSITGFDRTNHGGVDPEGPGRAAATDVLWITDVLAVSHEMHLSNSNGKHPWIFGFSVLANEIENDLLSQFTFASFGGAGAPFVTDTPEEQLVSPDQFAYSAPQDQDAIEIGVFGQVDWSLTDALTLTTGIRGQWYEKVGQVSSPGFFDTIETSIDEYGLSFNAGLSYQATDDVLLYGKVSQGIKSGSHAGGFIFSADSAPPAEQETLLSYEAGLKTQLFDDSLQFNGAVFFYDYKDLQSLTQRLVGTTFVQRYTNIGDAEVLGAEAELAWAPTENLLIRAGGTYLDAEIVRTNDFIFDNFDGNKLSTAPEFQGNWLVRYTLQGPAGSEIALQYDGNHAGDQFRNVDNGALGFDEATTKHNANLTVTSADENWELQLYGRNLTDELDFTWQFSFGGGQRRSYLAPRTYGAKLTRRF